jgi:phenylacetic acid degradation protein
VLRDLTEDELRWKVEGTESYQQLTRRSFASMRPTAPLAAPEPGRKPLELPELLPLSARKAKS